MNDLDLLLAFIAGMFVGQHLTVWYIKAKENT